MGPRSIQEYAESIRSRYRTVSRSEKSRTLTEVCRVIGYHRKSAIRLLNRRPRTSRVRRGRPRRYGPAVSDALKSLWETSNYLGAKRLTPFLPELIRVLEHQGALRLPPDVRTLLLQISAPTIDRLLQSLRPKALRHPYLSHPAAVHLQTQIPIRTFSEWKHVHPGSLQADLVFHSGTRVQDFYLTTLVAVDVATGWTECRAIWGRGYTRVRQALQDIAHHLPFPLRELHTDNGAEFLNHRLVPWCQQHGIRLTRGRPAKKNDQAYAEQKIWAVVRRLIGYDRYTTQAAYTQLAQLYDLLRLYLNFFQPTAKLVAKTRRGAKVRKRYDLAQTPYQRLRASSLLDARYLYALEARYLTLNPVQLRKQIHANLQHLWKLADPS